MACPKTKHVAENQGIFVVTPWFKVLPEARMAPPLLDVMPVSNPRVVTD